MTTEELHQKALSLPDAERAELAAELLNSLPAVLSEDDGGVGEARRRSQELDEKPEQGMSWEEIKSGLGR